MADDVHVIGSDYPEWANEKTLADLTAFYKKQAKKDTKIFREVLQTLKWTRNRELKSIMSLLEDISDNLKDGDEDKTQKKGFFESIMPKSAKTAYDKMSDIESGWHTEMLEYNRIAAENADNIYQLLKVREKDLGKESSDKGDKDKKKKPGGLAGLVSAIIPSLGVLKRALVGLTTVVFQLKDTYGALYTQGLMFEDGMGALMRSSARLAASSQEYAGIISEYSLVIRDKGIKSFTDMSLSVFKATQEMGGMNITLAESAEFLGMFLEQQRVAGVRNVMTQREQAQAAAENIERFTSLSRVMTVAREEIANTIDQVTRMETMIGFMRQMPEETRATVMESVRNASGALAALGPMGQQLAGDLGQMVSRPVSAMAENFGPMMAAAPQVGGEMMRLAEQVRNGNVQAEDQFDIMSNLGNAIERNEGRLHMLASVGDQTAQQMLSMVPQIEEFKDQFENRAAFEREMKRRDAMQEALQEGQEMWGRITNALRQGLAVLLETEGFKKIVRVLSAQVTIFSNNIEGWVKQASPLLEEFADWLVVALNSLRNFIGNMASGDGEMKEPAQIVSDMMTKGMDLFVNALIGKVGEIALGVLIASTFKSAIVAGLSAIAWGAMFTGIFSKSIGAIKWTGMFTKKMGTMVVSLTKTTSAAITKAFTSVPWAKIFGSVLSGIKWAGALASSIGKGILSRLKAIRWGAMFKTALVWVGRSLIPVLAKGLMAILGAVFSPAAIIGLIAAGLIALTIKYWDTIKEYAIAIWDGIKGYAVAVWDWLKGAFVSWFDWIKKVFTEIIPSLMNTAWEAFKSIPGRLMDAIKNIVGNLLPGNWFGGDDNETSDSGRSGNETSTTRDSSGNNYKISDEASNDMLASINTQTGHLESMLAKLESGANVRIVGSDGDNFDNFKGLKETSDEQRDELIRLTEKQDEINSTLGEILSTLDRISEIDTQQLSETRNTNRRIRDLPGEY